MASKTVDFGPLPRWDLSNVYPSLESEQFKRAVSDLRSELDDLEVFLHEHKITRTVSGSETNPDVGQIRVAIGGYLTRMNAALRLYSTLNAYVASFVTTDSYNTTAKRLESELEILAVRLRQHDVRFHGWIGLVVDKLPFVIGQDGPAKAHAFYLKETAEQSRYMMSEPEESLAAELELSGENAWSKLQGTLCSQLTVDFEVDGKIRKMPITELQNLKYHPKEQIRQRAYEAELLAWESVREPLAAALNGVKGSAVTLNKRRGRVDGLHSALDQARIDRQTLQTMLGAMQDSFPIFRRYLRAKAKRLDHDALPWWDLFAPVGKIERRYTWAEAKKLILTQFRSFSGRLAALAQRAFDHNWIDAEPRDGKRGGAFCMDVPAVDESRILCNFDGSLDQVSSIAHELGHAYHNECQVGKTILQTRTPMTLAETASTFCETIVAQAALAETSNAQEELAILETSLVNSSQIIVDTTSRYLFEKEVFERREKSELSADDFCEIMLRCQKATYGEGLDERFLHKYMWTWKGHYYIPDLSFYNFPYAFGLLFGTGLYALYKERGSQFVSDYESLLASTGEATPAELASRFGIDIHKSDFWRSSLKVIEQHIDRYLGHE
jgi:pepF/M3 family oligoendopeptidase